MSSSSSSMYSSERKTDLSASAKTSPPPTGLGTLPASPKKLAAISRASWIVAAMARNPVGSDASV
eukprot:5853381-Prymnesium_polylepis.2